MQSPRFVSILLVLSLSLCLCSCARRKDGSKTPRPTDHFSETAATKTPSATAPVEEFVIEHGATFSLEEEAATVPTEETSTPATVPTETTPAETNPPVVKDIPNDIETQGILPEENELPGADSL